MRYHEGLLEPLRILSFKIRKEKFSQSFLSLLSALLDTVFLWKLCCVAVVVGKNTLKISLKNVIIEIETKNFSPKEFEAISGENLIQCPKKFKKG